MSTLSTQIDDNGNAVAQTQTGATGAADVNIASGNVGIDQSTPGTSNAVSINKYTANSEYETVAQNASAQVIGNTGASGDYIMGILVVPATTSPGAVTLIDGLTSITVFTGGASSVSNLVPFYIPLGLRSVSGSWKITTGANVACVVTGDFT